MKKLVFIVGSNSFEKMIINPRTIIRKILLGMRKEIWMCSNCYTCYERCPQDVKFTDIIFALRNIAAREGFAHKKVEALQAG